MKKMLIYGPSGVGKTHLVLDLLNVEEAKPILYLDTDKGADTLGNQNINDIDTTFNNVDPDKFNRISFPLSKSSNRFKEMEELIVRLIGGKHPFKSVVIDSITNLDNINQYYRIATTPNVRRIAEGVASQVDYRVTQSDMQRLLSFIGELKILTIVIAWEYEIEIENPDPNGKPEYKYKPFFTGNMRIRSPHYFDVVMYYTPISSKHRIAYFYSTDRFQAKVRHNSEEFGKEFPADIQNPTLSQILGYFTNKSK